MIKFLSVSFLLICLTILGFMSFIHISARTSQDCSQFVIDSYELRSSIDIPAVENFNCYYDKQQNVRLSICTIQTNVSHFLKEYSFKKTPSTLETILSGSHLLNASEKPASSQLYLAEGRDGANHWKYIVEEETGRMWIEMKFD
jgi:hypothetical protein